MYALTLAARRPFLRTTVEQILKVYENNHIDPPWSHVLVLSLDVLMICAFAWCVREVLRAKEAAEQAKRIEESKTPLVDGARFVAGHVELAQDAKIAVRVTIKQEGEETKHKDSYSHQWTEIDREIEAVPFYLRTSHGDRIRVEPPNDVMLVDKLDQMEWQKQTQRRRRAELVPGEQAIIEGELRRDKDPELQNTSGYRETGARGWVMKPTKRRGMSISSEGLARRHELRAKAFIRTTIFTIVIGILSAAVTIPYRLRVIAGTNVIAQCMSRGIELGRNKGRTTKHYNAYVNYLDNSGIEQRKSFELDEDDYDDLQVIPGAIWMRVVTAFPWASALGKDSSANSLQVFFQVLIVGFGLLSIHSRQSYRRWYEGHLIDRGNGQLPVPPNSRFRMDAIDEAQHSPARSQAADVAPISTDFE